MNRSNIILDNVNKNIEFGTTEKAIELNELAFIIDYEFDYIGLSTPQ